MEETIAIQERILAKMCKLDAELTSRVGVLSELIEEKNQLMQKMSIKPSEPPVGVASEHFNYTLPQLNDVNQLQMRRKEQEGELNEMELKAACDYYGRKLLALQLKKHESVLKKWARDLESYSGRDIIRKEETVSNESIVTNVDYNCERHNITLCEDLGFTVLCRGVHLRAFIKSEMPCPSIHFVSQDRTMIGISTDTFVPGLEEKVKSSLSGGKPVTDVVQLMSQYIKDEMAPFAPAN